MKMNSKERHQIWCAQQMRMLKHHLFSASMHQFVGQTGLE